MPVMPEPAGVFLFIGLLGMERAVELRFAARNERRMLALGAKEYGRSFSRLLFAFHGAWFLAFGAEAALRGGRPMIEPGLVFAIMALLQALRYWCILSLGQSWNTKIIVRPGAPMVRKGLYRWLKHPNYLVVRIEIALYPALWGCGLTALLFGFANLLMVHQRIRQEERALRQA